MTNTGKFYTVEGRLKTFQNFPKIKGAPLCSPLGFAQAGFINISTKRIKDLVKCFACAKELDCWEPGDDPWKEHIKRGANCPFVLFRSKEKQTLGDFLDLALQVRLLELDRDVENSKNDIKNQFENILNHI